MLSSPAATLVSQSKVVSHGIAGMRSVELAADVSAIRAIMAQNGP
jgi:hypothetical protein